MSSPNTNVFWPDTNVSWPGHVCLGHNTCVHLRSGEDTCVFSQNTFVLGEDTVVSGEDTFVTGKNTYAPGRKAAYIQKDQYTG